MSISRNYQFLETASGYLFSVGAVFSKLQYIPITAIRATSNIATMILYLTAYMLWVAACRNYPAQSKENHYWYTFAEFKTQFTASAIIGTFAMAFSILALINPVVFVISAWLMVLSNFFWLVGERNKMQNPPLYKEMPDKQIQEIYFNYATIVFAISIITAMSLTGVLCFPAASVYIVSAATMISAGLTLWSFEHLLSSWFPEKPTLPTTMHDIELAEVSPSLGQMEPGVSPDLVKQNTPTTSARIRPATNASVHDQGSNVEEQRTHYPLI